mmetsp:Transcript_12088/g.29506  ORF Transcript_12088/g.29506 Transcript_12088/m.29506 type:complete len:149 (+) Transcript_12088:1537-1983(+)
MSEDTAAPLVRMGTQIMERMHDILGDACQRPSLLHGDLWAGNAGAVGDDEEPVVYDPACLFGHSEFDLALPRMFGGFSDDFFDAYHSVIPKAPGFDERQKVYQLYQYLKQLNLFGDPKVLMQCEELMQTIIADMPASRVDPTESADDS